MSLWWPVNSGAISRTTWKILWILTKEVTYSFKFVGVFSSNTVPDFTFASIIGFIKKNLKLLQMVVVDAVCPMVFGMPAECAETHSDVHPWHHHSWNVHVRLFRKERNNLKFRSRCEKERIPWAQEDYWGSRHGWRSVASNELLFRGCHPSFWEIRFQPEQVILVWKRKSSTLLVMRSAPYLTETVLFWS